MDLLKYEKSLYLTKPNKETVDHLFRQQYGKMVAILIRIFGLSNLELIEDAVQDTFISALKTWEKKPPDNPEAWLTTAAKNRTIDLLRKLKVDTERLTKLNTGPSTIALQDLFLDHEIEDSQLRMIFTACHPLLTPVDQISFALKSISGFTVKEIASLLLLKQETVKKRLTRARQQIKATNISFEIPAKQDLTQRLERVHEVIYLIFTEGFHSGKKDILIRKDLCGEAIRLIKLILKKPMARSGNGYALLSLMCVHAARLDSKLTESGALIDLKHQDRSLWYKPLIDIGRAALTNTNQYQPAVSSYLFEAAIALSHATAKTFEETNWDFIFLNYQKMQELYPNPFTLVNMAIVKLQQNQNQKAFELLNSINPQDLQQREYLFYGTMADYYLAIGNQKTALLHLDTAIQQVSNEAEKNYLMHKREKIQKPQ